MAQKVLAGTPGATQSTTQKVISRVSYAFGAFGNDMFYGALSTYFIMFVTTHLFNGGNQAHNNRMILYITTIIAVLRVVELIIDPFIGNWIDRTKTRFGQFKPWVVVGGTVTSIALLLLFTDLGGINRTHPALYLVVFAILYITMDIFYSFKDVAFWSMIPALSFSSAERERTASSARVGSTLGGGLVGVIVMPLVLFFSLNKAGGTGDERGWFAFGLMVAIVGIVTAIIVGLGTHEVQSDLRKNKENTVGFKKIFKTLAQNDQLMWIALTYGIYAIGINILNSLVLYYFTFILGKSTLFSVFQTVNIIISLVSVSIFPKLVDKFNRKRVFASCIAIMLAGIALFAVAGKNFWLVLTAAEMFQVPQAVVFLVVLMIITDSVEYGQWKLGHRDESLTLSIRPLLDKLGGAISNGVVGQVAVIAGMTSGATAASITAAGQAKFKVMMFAVPAVLLIIAMFIFWKKSTLTEAKHAEIVESLEKTWGKTLTPEEAVATDTTVAVSSPINGTVVDLASVSDATFASGQVGQGFAIKPTDGKVLAPFDAQISRVFETRHAIGMVTADGVALLIHVGFDTVSMNGTGFVSYVTEGQAVKQGTELIEFWDPAIQKAGLDDTVAVVVTNSAKFKDFKLNVRPGETVTANDVTIATLTK
ncbi:glycoside-pentoside-hexuronide (GPH):cation symporter [Lactiplantibacillus modestisalitolerans]|uniref:Glycoside-pentoside-hexuronide (GPH):cation symporter n=1 Tax=Lactiplantibacillus modestisalitolerans TaxID=1457219 RepID=A0ABV5WSQ5_9LACO|nr:glycoside-pentoside-hexuronide (GPH):cation symporter [Lactiplantibacillus modestisalitolerans]